MGGLSRCAKYLPIPKDAKVCLFLTIIPALGREVHGAFKATPYCTLGVPTLKLAPEQENMEHFASKLTFENNPTRRQHLCISGDEGIAYHDILRRSFPRDNRACHGIRKHSLIDSTNEVW